MLYCIKQSERGDIMSTLKRAILFLFPYLILAVCILEERWRIQAASLMQYDTYTDMLTLTAVICTLFIYAILWRNMTESYCFWIQLQLLSIPFWSGCQMYLRSSVRLPTVFFKMSSYFSQSSMGCFWLEKAIRFLSSSRREEQIKVTRILNQYQ